MITILFDKAVLLSILVFWQYANTPILIIAVMPILPIFSNVIVITKNCLLIYNMGKSANIADANLNIGTALPLIPSRGI